MKGIVAEVQRMTNFVAGFMENIHKTVIIIEDNGELSVIIIIFYCK